VLGMTSLLQFIFLSPLGGNWIVGLTLVSLFGFYKTFINVFAFYFFAKDIQDNNFHVGFWLALYNTIVVAEGLGYNVMSLVLHKCGVLNMKWHFGGAAVANFFGLTMVWRISGRNLHN
jgi:hypothetical protein